ncbi:hypothetical protein MILUP08_45312 [Micromonospora lupini str. Lupac 08]|uniref:Uncharacterized protein n=1 Tax=Micromonospora lupini str. Lupac 08 TaxID=1150864 RepID=I0L9D3_9ACTN|nr:hypothetical protein MILUP08_45312 [Micromonospora lupini str. Lupac 08]
MPHPWSLLRQLRPGHLERLPSVVASTAECHQAARPAGLRDPAVAFVAGPLPTGEHSRERPLPNGTKGETVPDDKPGKPTPEPASPPLGDPNAPYELWSPGTIVPPPGASRAFAYPWGSR